MEHGYQSPESQNQPTRLATRSAVAVAAVGRPRRLAPRRGIAAPAVCAALAAAALVACHDDPLRLTARAAARASSSVSATAGQTLTWYIARPGYPDDPGFDSFDFGAPGDVPVPADYDGDQHTDVATRRADASGRTTWYLRRSSAGFTATQWGLATDSAVAADYDGDGKADVAIWRPTDGSWWVYGSATNAQRPVQQFGQAGDVPLPARYTHTAAADSRVDYAVWRPSNGTWYTLTPGGAFSAVQFGQAGDIPVPGDYDGDGRTDFAVWRPSTGTWYVLRSRDGLLVTQFGQAGDVPVPADYDGDGRTDIAVRRPTDGAAQGVWYLLQSTRGLQITSFGYGTDIPVPGRYDGTSRAQLATVRRTDAPPAVASVTVTPSTVLLKLPIGPIARQLTATVRDANGNVLPDRVVHWSSSNPEVADVDPLTGLVSANGVGTAVITATSEGISAQATVRVIWWEMCQPATAGGQRVPPCLPDVIGAASAPAERARAGGRP